MVQSTVKWFCLLISPLSSPQPSLFSPCPIAAAVGTKDRLQTNFSRQHMEVAIAWTDIEPGHFYALLCISQTFASSAPLSPGTCLHRSCPSEAYCSSLPYQPLWMASRQERGTLSGQWSASFSSHTLSLYGWETTVFCFSSVSNQLWESSMEELGNFLSSQSFSKLANRYLGLLTEHFQKTGSEERCDL